MTNLIMIDCHDLGQHLGCYGWATSPTPNIDALAARGLRFENNFCTAPQCSPSRAALYTGRYPHANGMFGLAHHPFNWRLHPEEKHLAAILKEAGYQTTLIGIQHLTAYDRIESLGYEQVTTLFRSEDIGQETAAFLAAPPPSPFFLKVGFFDPHRDFNGRFKQAPPNQELGVEIPPYLPQTPEAELEMAELQGVIAAMDRAVGQIWSALEQSGVLEDSWIIFTTDHGVAMPRAKCTLYDPGIETALIMFSEPFQLLGGKVYDQMISNVDLVPTILEMLGIAIPSNLHGRSFAHMLNHEDYSERDAVFAEKTFHTAYEPQRAIRTKRYKLIWNVEVDIMNVPGDIMHSPIYPQMIEEITEERPYFELYDLADDPHERHNLVDDPAYEDVFNDLRERLLAWMKETDDPILEGPIASPYYHYGLLKLDDDQ